MAEQEVVIRISAKNLTAGEFKKARREVLGLGDEVGKTKDKTSALTRGFQAFGKAAPGAFKLVAKAAAVTVGAIAAVTVAVIKLGQRGAAVADVQSAFDALSVSAGETGAIMLGALSAGVKGTVSNFDLMKVANKALGVGLLKTSEDAQTLSEGARLLAKRTGGDTVQAFETLVTAMASGRTAQLKQIGLFVDNKQAIEDFAKATGKSVSEINDADRATALQIATMAALRKELESFPPPLSDFGELIERGSIGVKNLVDELAVMISESPVLIGGMKAVADAISKAFGGNTQGLIEGVVRAIEFAAFAAIEFGKVGITAAEVVTRGFAGIKVLVLGVALAFVEVAKQILSANATILETAAQIPVVGVAYKDAAKGARFLADATGAVAFGLKEQVVEAAAAAAGNDNLGRSFSAAREALDQITESMIVGLPTQQAMNQATADGVVKVTALGAAFAGANFQIQSLTPVMIDWQGKLVETSEATLLWKDIINESFQETTTSQQAFGAVVVGVGDQQMASNERVKQSAVRLGITTRDESQKTEAQIKADIETMITAYGRLSDEAIAAQKKLDEFRLKSTEETTLSTLGILGAAAGAADTIAKAAGSNFKGFAIAESIIATYLSIAKTLATTAWPLNLILAAGAAAAGFANVAKIRSSSAFQEGTQGLDFQDFGPSSLAALHGREAVIPEAGVGAFAGQVAAALNGGRERTDMQPLLEEFRSMRADFASLPFSIQRAVRDGVLLAS